MRVLPAWSGPEQGIYAIYPGNRFIPAKVRAFVEYLTERMNSAKRADPASTAAFRRAPAVRRGQ